MWGPGRRTPVTVRRWVVVAVAGLTVAGACSGGDDDGITGPTIPTDTRVTTTTSTTTTVAPASYDVPEVIDQAYVQRVVSAYDKVLGDAIRDAMKKRRVDETFLKYLIGIYGPDEIEFQQNLWVEAANDGSLFARSLDEPGDPKTAVLALVESRTNCVVVRAERDYAPTLRDGETAPESPQDDYIVLTPKPIGRDPLNVNLTPWVMAFDGFKKDNSVPSEACDE